MLTVLDNVLDENSLRITQEHFEPIGNRNIRWVSGTLELFTNKPSPIAKLLQSVARVFDITKMAGFEQWAHHGTKTGWHADKDEVFFTRTGGLRTPICSIVFYAKVDNLTGGSFRTEDICITPKTNRLVVFGPGIYHGVDDFSGVRVAVAINPWATTPEGYDPQGGV